MIFGYFVVSPTDHGKYDVINYQNKNEFNKILINIWEVFTS